MTKKMWLISWLEQEIFVFTKTNRQGVRHPVSWSVGTGCSPLGLERAGSQITFTSI